MQHESETPEQVFVRHMKARREADGWSQRKLASSLEPYGVKLDATAITRIEGGTRALRLNEAAAIARALDVAVDALLLSAPTPTEQLLEAQHHQARAQWRAIEATAEYDAARARVKAVQEEKTEPDYLA